MKEITRVAENTNFVAVNVGKLDQLSEYTILHPSSGRVMEGKVFLKDITGSTGTEISYNVLPPKAELPYFHTHTKNEETYLILSGSGMYQVDEECFEISEGSIVRVAPNGKRGMVNTSDEAMIYIVIQSKEGSLQEYSSEDGHMAEFLPKWKK